MSAQLVHEAHPVRRGNGAHRSVGALATAAFSSIVSPAPRDIWQRLMRDDPMSLPYQSPEWIDTACATSNYVDVSRCYTTPTGAQYVLPMIRRARRPSWMSIASSMPNAWGIGGIVGSAPLTLPVLEAVLDDVRRQGFLGVHLRPNPLQAALWAAAKPGLVVPRRAHVIDLSGGFEAVWTRFPTAVRTKVRKAERNVEIEFDDTGRLLPVLLHLLDRSQERWAKAQHEPQALARFRADLRDPPGKFEYMAAAKRGASLVGIASIEGQPAAAILVLLGRNANCSRSAMDPQLIGSSGANELLQRHAIELAAAAGCQSYHMGESGKSASLGRYKEKFGAVGYDYAEYRLERLPFTRAQTMAKGMVKRLIGFKDGH
jgi:hypothetical protein